MRDFAKDGEWEYAVEMARLVAPDGTLHVVEQSPRVPDAIRGNRADPRRSSGRRRMIGASGSRYAP